MQTPSSLPFREKGTQTARFPKRVFRYFAAKQARDYGSKGSGDCSLSEIPCMRLYPENPARSPSVSRRSFHHLRFKSLVLSVYMMQLQKSTRKSIYSRFVRAKGLNMVLCYINRAFLHRAFSEKMLPDSSFPYMIKLDEAGGLAVVSSLFVCRYERRYAAGEGSFPRKAEVLRRRSVMFFNQLYQQKTIHRGNIRDRICNKKAVSLPDRTAFCCLMCLSYSCFSKHE